MFRTRKYFKLLGKDGTQVYMPTAISPRALKFSPLKAGIFACRFFVSPCLRVFPSNESGQE